MGIALDVRFVSQSVVLVVENGVRHHFPVMALEFTVSRFGKRSLPLPQPFFLERMSPRFGGTPRQGRVPWKW
jgi:hypothetical protein